jgi:hypothetical protein
VTLRSKLNIQTFEEEIAEHILGLANRFDLEGRVTRLKQVDKGLWQATVSLEQIYEPEVLLTGNRIQAFSCDCTAGRKKIPCAHMTALLIQLKRFRAQRQEEIKARRKALVRLKTSELLELVPHDQVYDFLNEQLKKSKQLENAFRYRFFSYRDKDRSVERIHELILPYLDENGVIIYNDPVISKEISELVDQILTQSNDLIERGETETGYQFCLAIIQYLRTGKNSKLYLNLAGKIGLWIEQKSNQINRIEDNFHFEFLLSGTKIAFTTGLTSLVNQFILSIQAYSGHHDARQRIFEMTTALIHEENFKNIEILPVLLAHIQNMPTAMRHTPWLDELPIPPLHPQHYSDLANLLIEGRDFEDGLTVINSGLKRYSQHIDLKRMQCLILWELNQKDLLVESCKSLVCATLEPQDLDKAYQYLDKKRFKSLSSFLLKHFKELPPTFIRYRLESHYYLLTDNLPEVQTVILESQSKKLLMEILYSLDTKHEIWMSETCVLFIKNYLNDHIGPPATKTVQDILKILGKRGLSKAIASLNHYLRTFFPERVDDWRSLSIPAI